MNKQGYRPMKMTAKCSWDMDQLRLEGQNMVPLLVIKLLRVAVIKIIKVIFLFVYSPMH